MRGALLAVLAACGGHGGGSFDARPDAPVFEQVLSTDVDVLFVIDNSSNTSDKQTVFAANFPKFVAALDAFPTGRPNLHIGIVSTTVDIGAQGFGPGCPSPAPLDNGLLQNTPRVTGCSAPTGRFISDIKNATGGRTVNYSGTIDAAFSCIAQLGSTGCGFEAPLEGMKRALDGTRPENAGFLRTGAYLLVVILTDEDDCSVADSSLFSLPESEVGPGDFRCQPLYAYNCDTPISATMAATYTGCTVRTGSYLSDPASYMHFLETIKPPGQVLVATVIGDPKIDANGKASITTIQLTSGSSQSLALAPSCDAVINGNPTRGNPGIRIDDFVKQAGPGRGSEYSICQSDYSAALTDIGSMLYNATSGCILGTFSTADTDPANPGTQLDCAVEDDSTPLPACTMETPTTVDPSNVRPCWWSSADANACPSTDSHLLVHIERSSPAPVGTVTQFRCN